MGFWSRLEKLLGIDKVAANDGDSMSAARWIPSDKNPFHRGHRTGWILRLQPPPQEQTQP